MNAINDQLLPAAAHGVLRFITAGSVDDGKSTLIGRLLYDSKTVFSDQLRALEKTRHRRPDDENVNLAMLTDGLEDEREQGITIDVAYRYFATPARKFIVADAPGHEQYTRNMVTGASTAHAAIILIDAVKAADGRLLVQTVRHSTLAHLLGVRHLIVAVNKLDLLDWREDVFRRIESAYADLANQLGIGDFTAIPVSALLGDNVVRASGRMPWYRGPTLLSHLEALDTGEDRASEPLRMPVQWVMRHNGSRTDGLRAYAGQIASGTLKVGDTVVAQPSGAAAIVKSLHTPAGPVQRAIAGTPVTVELAQEIDVSRGDWFSHESHAPIIARRLVADMCWLDSRTLSPARKYLIKHGARLSSAKIERVLTRRDLMQLAEAPASDGATLSMNDIGCVALRTRDALPVDCYASLPASGAFILIDEASHQTVAGGMIRAASPL
ncbi:sulfate adenylyltransferase [Pusillimonas sp. TS35]|uniref:sulfate adenylyltransferase subunit 1 n=1 Tax=Paracandidimonas lactea TaxID=2895524 RepID=UPI0013685602|nr:GTP-binding protein [Paracandidimonas lactea]MYN12146.1 sulfate adenylyltransferase [Pusillimonas sp. TS35]